MSDYVSVNVGRCTFFQAILAPCIIRPLVAIVDMNQATDALIAMASTMSKQLETAKNDYRSMQNAFMEREQKLLESQNEIARRMLEQKDSELLIEREKIRTHQQEIENKRRTQESQDIAVVHEIISNLTAQVFPFRALALIQDV